MGSGNTKGRRSAVERAQHETRVDSQTYTNDKLFPANAVEATTTNNVKQASREPETIQEYIEDKKSEQTTAEPVSKTDQILVDFVNENPELRKVSSRSFAAIKGLKECLESGRLQPTESSTGVNAHVSLLNNMYFKPKDDEARLKVGDFVTALGFPKFVRDVFATLRSQFPKVTTEDYSGKEGKEKENKEEKSVQDFLAGDLTAVVVNFSDLNDNFCIACAEAGLVTVLVEMSNELKTCIPNIAKDEIPRKGRGGILRRFLSILHNLSRRTPCRIYFKNCQVVELLAPFLKAEATIIATKGLLVLAYLIDEKNNKMIMSDEEPIAFLIGILEKSLDNAADRHRFRGFSTVELAEGLGKIASNDGNKKQIGRNNGVPFLVRMIKEADTEEEKYVAAETLWILSFDEENKKTIREDEDAMNVLHELQQSQESRTRKAAAGVLWELQGKDVHSEKATSVIDSSQHVMISYQWDVQGVVLQIRDKLQSLGFKVWLDVDEMGGSTLESMAKAVENAAVVLMCVSQKYKDSPNCRSEAEYTYKLHRDIIPLMMDINYKPDGWLGILLGVKFWIDFHNKRTVNSSLEKLVKELKDKGKQLQETPIKALSAEVVDSRPNRPDVHSWTQTDVAKWLEELGLETISIKAKERLDGTFLIRLHSLRKESPDFFYASLKGDFYLSDVFDVLKFTDALEELVQG